MDDLRIPLQRPAPASDVAPAHGAASGAGESGWGRVLAVSSSRAALALALGLVMWSVLPMVVGWTPRAIMSGSMEPRIHVGDVVVGRPVDPNTLVKGQVVTVVDPDHPQKTRTHRLLRRDAQGRLVLKGDANPQADSTPVLPAKVLGLGVVRVPYVARPAYWVAERAFLPLGLSVLALVALGVTAAAPLRLPEPPGRPAPAGPPDPDETDDHGSVDQDHDQDDDDRRDPPDDDPSDGDGSDGDRPHDVLAGSRGRGVGLDILRPRATPAAGRPEHPGRLGRSGRPGGVVRGLTDRRWALVTAVLAGAAACLVVTAPTQAAYAVTTSNPTNSFAAAATFSTYAGTVLADGPLLYWRLDEASGTAVADLSGQGNPGVASGSYTRGATGALASEPGNAAITLTAGQVVETNPTSGLAARFTVEAWVRTTSANGGLVVGLNSGSGPAASDDRVLYVGTDGKARFGVGGGPARSVAVSTAVVTDGKWHHLVGTVDGNGAGVGNDTATLYVDGGVQGTASKASAALSSGSWRIGTSALTGWPSAPPSGALTGSIDEVAVFNTPLSSTRVKAHYDAGVTP